MITRDEAVFAGGFGGKNNSTYYLYTNKNYWTMSPRDYRNDSHAMVFYVNSNGFFSSADVCDLHGFRPVINLRADTKFTGTGSSTNPFIVV